MSDVIRLRLRAADPGSIRVEHITADRLATLSEREIATLAAWHDRRACQLGELFEVDGGHSACVHVEGALGTVDGLGEGMTGGELTIEGDAGDRTGMNMTGGRIEVLGSVGSDAAVAMSGGRLIVHGSAGPRLGAMLPGAAKGMTGGEIVVHGSTAGDAGARMRRGLIVVMGDAGESAVRNMIAGSMIVFGRTADGAASGNKRGTLVAIGGMSVPAGYAYACTFRPPHLLLTMRYLRREFGLRIDEPIACGRFRRYCGDAGQPGKGEILEWVSA